MVLNCNRTCVSKHALHADKQVILTARSGVWDPEMRVTDLEHTAGKTEAAINARASILTCLLCLCVLL